MLFSFVIYNWVGILGTLIGAVLWVIVIAVALKLLKVARPVPWMIAGTTLVAAGFLLTLLRGGVALTVIGFLGILLAGSLVYLITRPPSARKVGGVVSVILVGLALFLTLVRTGSFHELGTSERDYVVVGSMHNDLLQAQAARIRELREQEDRQRRKLFDSRESTPANADGSTADSGQITSLKTSPGVAWYPEVDERFDSDVQPSMTAAGRSLGRKLLPLVKHVMYKEADPEIIQIHQYGLYEDALKAIDDLAAVMRRSYPDAQVLVEKVSHSQGGLSGKAISIRLTNSNIVRTNQQFFTSTSPKAVKVDLTAQLKGTAGGAPKEFSVSVTMVDKPWVDQFDVFLASNRGDDLLIDARSGRLETSQLDARNAAIEDAVNMLTPVAMEVLKAQRQPMLRTPNVTEVSDRLKAALLGGQFIEDSFSQQLTHPMGNLWREAILVRVDYDSLRRVIGDLVQQQRATEQGQLSLTVALVLLALGIIVLHMILNWITKGYYRKSVGMLSGLLAVVGVLGILILAMTIFGPGQV